MTKSRSPRDDRSKSIASDGELPRRRFLQASAAALATTAACAPRQQEGAAAVHTRPNVQWRLVSSFPRSLDTIWGVAEVAAERVEQLSEGRFRVRPYPAGELVPAFQVLDAVQRGTVQAGATASYYYTGKNPALAFDTAVPFGLTARQQTAWLAEGGGGDLVNELYSDFGIRAFPGGNTGAQMGGWFRRAVGSLADLRGLKMRIPGLGGEIMNRLGVTVQSIPGGEIYPALERGAIDATEWVGPYDDEILGLQKIADFYYYPGWWEPGPGLSFLVNEAAWSKLPVEYQQIWTAATREAHGVMMSRYDALNPPAFERLVAGGTDVRPFPRDLMEAAARESEALMEELAVADGGYRKIYEAWKAFREQSYRWFGTAEQEYAAFAFPRAGR